MKRNINAIVEAFLQAFVSIRGNKMRAFLTILGIVIGVMTVIGMVAIIQGLNANMKASLQDMGPNLVQFQRDEPVHFGRPSQEERMRKPLTYEDALAIRENSPGIKAVSPEAYKFNVTLKYRGEESTGLAFGGVETTFNECNNMDIAAGRGLIESDLQHATPVVVIGQNIVNALFPGGIDPIGKTVLANGFKFHVIGTFKKKGAAFLGESNDRYVIIPFTTFMKLFPDSYREQGVNIATIPKDGVSVATAIDQGTAALRRKHGLRADKPNDFAVMTPDNLMKTFNQITGAIYLVMIVISSIGLMVGGVGVMNIMLVSVKERTREIGLRKALGARSGDIMWQFLIEAVVLCLIGGALGIGVGTLVAFLVRTLSPLPAEVSAGAVIAAIVVSSSVGLFFGIFPARKAAHQDPILALHYE